jgi:hypothetical protein
MPVVIDSFGRFHSPLHGKRLHLCYPPAPPFGQMQQRLGELPFADTTSLVACFTNTGELHERIYAPYEGDIAMATTINATYYSVSWSALGDPHVGC